MKLAKLKEDHGQEQVMLDPADDDSIVCKDHFISISDSLFEINKDILIEDPATETAEPVKEKTRTSRKRS